MRQSSWQAAVVVAAIALSPIAATAETIKGRASVIDGDTIEIHGVRIRLHGIDAPEGRQRCTRNNGRAWRNPVQDHEGPDEVWRATARSKSIWQPNACWWMPPTRKKPGLS